MVSGPVDLRVHYHAAFDVKGTATEDETWRSIVRMTRSWIKGKEMRRGSDVEELGRAWFFVAGEWKGKGSRVEVRSLEDAGTPTTPRHWAMRYDEPCGQVQHRRWRTDIGVSQLGEELVSVGVRVSHYLTPGFIGDEPEPPLASSPRLVRAVLEEREWRIFSGPEELSAEPQRLELGGVPDFVARLTAPTRAVPLVLVSECPDQAGVCALDPYALARGLAGAVSVVVMSSADDLLSEFNYYVPYRYRCSDGMVRVYMPRVELTSDADSRRHRFFLRDYVETTGPDHVVDMLARGLARRPLIRRPSHALDIDDVSRRRVEAERAQLRERLRDAADGDDLAAQKQLVEFALDENSKLEDELLAAREETSTALKTVDDLQLAIDLQAEEAKTIQGGLEHQTREATQRAERLQSQLAERDAVNAAILALEGFPRDLEGVLGLVREMYAGRVVILDDAFDSASGWDFDVDHAWRALKAVAQVLPELHFETDGVDVAKEFKTRTGFDLAMSEGKLTKQNKKAVRERTVMYEGHAVDITAHVKIGSSKPNLLRVHYYPDHDKKLIVIGHCGDHLTTAGTRKRK